MEAETIILLFCVVAIVGFTAYACYGAHTIVRRRRRETAQIKAMHDRLFLDATDNTAGLSGVWNGGMYGGISRREYDEAQRARQFANTDFWSGICRPDPETETTDDDFLASLYPNYDREAWNK